MNKKNQDPSYGLEESTWIDYFFKSKRCYFDKKKSLSRSRSTRVFDLLKLGYFFFIFSLTKLVQILSGLTPGRNFITRLITYLKRRPFFFKLRKKLSKKELIFNSHAHNINEFSSKILIYVCHHLMVSSTNS
jgi:hypothetical protein